MKTNFLFTSLLSIAFTGQAQNKTAADYAPLINEEKLKQCLTILTSDDLAGRETSTPGEAKAAAFVASQMKNAGLSSFRKAKKYLQYYRVDMDSFVSAGLTIGNHMYTVGKQFAMYTIASFNQHVKAKELVFVGYGITDSAYDDYGTKDVKGKIVVIASGEPMNADSTWLLTGTKKGSGWIAENELKKLQEAKKRGAKAIFSFPLQSSGFTDTVRRFMMRNGLKYNKERAPLNRAYISHHIMDSLFGKETFSLIFDAAKRKKALNQLQIKTLHANIELTYREATEKRKARNVVGYIKGSEKPGEYVFLTAHMDHLGTDGKNIYRGADDDGSGTSAVIAMATAFSAAAKEGNGPKRSVIFMTVSGEEKGLWGSAYATDHPLVDLAQISADINIDMIGRIDPKRKKGDSLNYIYAVGSDKISTEMNPLLEQVNKVSENLELDYKFDDPDDKERIYFRSDHYNFAKHGVPIVFFYNGSHPDYHRITDTIDKINFGLMEKRARLAFFLAWQLANRKNMLLRDLPVPTETR